MKMNGAPEPERGVSRLSMYTVYPAVVSPALELLRPMRSFWSPRTKIGVSRWLLEIPHLSSTARVAVVGSLIVR